MEDNKRTICVTGRGRLALSPDTVRLSLALKNTCPDYGEAIRRLSEDTEKLKAVLAPLGFAGNDLRTVYFNVDAKYEGVPDPNGVYREEFRGYEYFHTMKLEFPREGDLLARTLRALSDSPVFPEVRIAYAVRDVEQAKNLLLSRAVEDAKNKALALSAAAGVGLGALVKMEYRFDESDFEVAPMARELNLRKLSADNGAGGIVFDLNPDDMNVTDQVTLTWELL